MKEIFTHLSKICAIIFLITQIDIAISYFRTHVPPQPQSTLALLLPPPLFRITVLGSILLITFFAPKNTVFPYIQAYFVPLITWYTANYGSYWAIIWSVLGIISMLEIVCGEDTQNPSPEEEKELSKRYSFRLVTMLWTPAQLLLLFWASYAVSIWNLKTFDFIIFSISIGFNTGILGINIAHELIHKKNQLELFLGKVLLVSVCYGHWYIEHLWGHHKMVSTPYDPATARFGESLYGFIPRSVYGSFLSALHLEKERLNKKNLAWWHNEVITLSAASAIFSGFIYYIWGYNALIMFFIQSVVAFSLLEIVNYIEHYGLERKLVGKSYEAVNPTHSWNSNARITNYFLFKLQRHSDHHAYAGRRYQVLRNFESAPQMPTGYAGMLCISLIPPLWFYIMNKRAKEYYCTG